MRFVGDVVVDKSRSSGVAVPMVTYGSSQSVVSEDSRREEEEDEEDLDNIEPLPLNAWSMTDNQDVVMEGWGMPFHYLGSLDHITEEATAVAYTCPSSDMVDQLLNDGDLDLALEDLLHQNDHLDLAHMLERVVS